MHGRRVTVVDPTQQEPRSPGIPGFAKIFAFSSRQRGDGEPPSALSRILLAALAILVLGGAGVGIGKLIGMQNNTKENEGKKIAAGATRTPSASSPTSGKTQVKKPGSSNTSVALPALPGSPSPHAKPGSSYSPTPGSSSPSSSSQGTQNSTQRKNTSTGYRFVNSSSNLCVDIKDHIQSAPPKTPLQIYRCGDNPNQRWTVNSDGTLRSLGMCMSVLEGSTANGASVDVYTCNGTPSQQWKLISAGEIVNVKADKCLDVRDQQASSGTPLQLWSCTGQSNQKWAVG